MNSKLVRSALTYASFCCCANAFAQFPSFSLPSPPPISKIGGSISGGFHQGVNSVSSGAQHAVNVTKNTVQQRVVNPVVQSGQHAYKEGTKLGTSAPVTHFGTNVANTIKDGSRLGTSAPPIHITPPHIPQPHFNPNVTTAKVSSGLNQLADATHHAGGVASGVTQHSAGVVEHGYIHSSQLLNQWNIDPSVHQSTTNKWLTNFDSGTLPARNNLGTFASEFGTALSHAMVSNNSGAQDQSNQGTSSGTASGDSGDSGSSGNSNGSSGGSNGGVDQPQQVTGAFLTGRPSSSTRSSQLSNVVHNSASSLQRTGSSDPRRPVSTSR